MPPIYIGSRPVIARYIGSRPVQAVMYRGENLLGAAAPALPFFSAALAARRANPSTVRQARVITLGHSWTGGGGSGTDDGRDPAPGEDMYGLLNSFNLSWTAKLCSYLNAAGIATMRNAWIGDQRGPIGAYGLKDIDPGRHAYNTADVIVQASQSLTLGAHPLAINGGDKEYTFTPGFAFTSFKLWGLTDFTVGSEDVELYVDGVSQIHFTSKTGSSKWGSFPLAGGIYAYAGTSIKLVNRHATRKFALSGIECFGPTTDACDVFVTQCGRGGAKLSDFVTNPTSEYTPIKAVPKYVCDLLIIQAIVNDANGAYSTYSQNGGDEVVLQAVLDTWKANIQLLYDSNPAADIILVGDPEAPTGSADEYIVSRFHDAARQVIAANGKGVFVDLWVPFGRYANSYALGYRHIGDSLHPSGPGHDKIGEYMAQVIASSV